MPKPALEKSYYVVGGDHLINVMFQKRGWREDQNGTLLVFSGGEDVSPVLYGDAVNPKTRYSLARDKEEAWWYLTNQKKNKVGICRGGQFLNVMNGGKMYQDVDGHVGNHFMKDRYTGEKVFVTSTHHQMMIPNYDTGMTVCATANEATRFECAEPVIVKDGEDIESVYYQYTRTLCYQPHPEYELKSCEDHFFFFLSKLFGY